MAAEDVIEEKEEEEDEEEDDEEEVEVKESDIAEEDALVNSVPDCMDTEGVQKADTDSTGEMLSSTSSRLCIQ